MSYAKLKIISVIAIMLCVVPLASFTAQAGAESPEKYIFCAEGKSYAYYPEKVDASNHLIYDEIYARKINSTVFEKSETMEKCILSGSTYEYAVNFAYPLLNKFVDRLEDKLGTKAANAEITFSYPDKVPFNIKREKKGKQIDRERLYRSFYTAVKHRLAKVDVVFKESLATVNANELAKQTYLKSSFCTYFALSGDNRKQNIITALNKINGKVLAPGAEFSFNEVVGKRTEANGFLMSKIIVNGIYTEGVGGGVCQVATTLYNSALLAGLKINEVRNHSLLPSYIEPSFDAMVNSGSSDLRFVNDTDRPVYIGCSAEGDTAKINLYGVKNDKVIKRVSQLLSSDPIPPDEEFTDVERKYVGESAPSMAKIRLSYGMGAKKSEGSIEIYDLEGNLKDVKKIRKDQYKSVKGLIAVAP